MRRTFYAAAALVWFAIAAPARADDYTVDDVHSSVGFKIQHLGISWIQGRFDEFSGSFTLDKDPAKSSFSLTLKAESIDVLLNRLKSVKIQKAELERAEQELMVLLRDKIREQKQQLQTLGILMEEQSPLTAPTGRVGSPYVPR